VLAAQQHVDAIITALLSSRGQPAETAAMQQYLDDAHVVARAAVSAVNGTASPPAAAIAVLEELGARTRPGAAASALASCSAVGSGFLFVTSSSVALITAPLPLSVVLSDQWGRKHR